MNIPRMTGSTSNVDDWYTVNTDRRPPHRSSFLMFQWGDQSNDPLYGRTLAHDALDASTMGQYPMSPIYGMEFKL